MSQSRTCSDSKFIWIGRRAGCPQIEVTIGSLNANQDCTPTPPHFVLNVPHTTVHSCNTTTLWCTLNIPAFQLLCADYITYIQERVTSRGPNIHTTNL